MEIAGFVISLPPLALGLVSGLAYAVLAVGLVLVFRSSGIVNLALGEIGAAGAVFMFVAVARWGWPYWPAFVVGLAGAGTLGALVNVTVVRRLRRAPQVMTLVAMLGVGQIIFAIASGFGSVPGSTPDRVHPTGIPSVEIGAFLVTPSYATAFVLCPIVLVAIALFLTRHRLGRLMRASAAVPELARASGISPDRMASLAWGLAGALAALVAILLSPAEQTSGQGLGFWLLLRALAAASLAGMRSLPLAALAGIGIGVVEQLLFWNTIDAALRDVLLFGVIAIAILVRRMPTGRGEETGSWLRLSTGVGSEELRRITRSPVVRAITATIALGTTVALLATASPTGATRLYFVFAFATVGYSVLFITGLGGELSLGQFAVAALGAAASIALTVTSGNFVLGLLVAGCVGAAASLGLGALTMKARGHSLAIITLAFAVTAESWLFPHGWMFGDGVFPGQPVIGGLALDTAVRYAPFAGLIFLLVALLARNVWQTQMARRIVAFRDNDVAARAFGVTPWKARASAHAVGGFAAGVGGAVFVHGLFLAVPSSFPVTSSVAIVALAALGGLGSLWGPLLGALYIAGLPELLPTGWGYLAATASGWLLLLLIFPGGLAQAAARIADRLRRGTAKQAEQGSIADNRIPRLLPRTRAQRVPAPNHPLLHATGVTKTFHEVAALQDVEVSVGHAMTIGIVGANGVGKTTLLDVLSGSIRADAGRVFYDGLDITGWQPEARADAGLIRSFEDATLFPTMNVLDVVHLATSGRDPRSSLHLVLRGGGAEKRSRERAHELIHLTGMGRFTERRIGELSSGMRRLVELTCVIALEPRLLLLDEPTSGLAQAEVAALVEVLKAIREHLALSMVVVEHDLSVVGALCDPVLVLDSGRVLAQRSAENFARLSGIALKTNGDSGSRIK